MTVKLTLLTLFLLSIFTLSTQQCGRLERCDRLVRRSIFELGVCGRTARCLWELMHFDRYLLGKKYAHFQYYPQISALLCAIPTFEVYSNLTTSSKRILYNPCGGDLDHSATRKQLVAEYGNFSMPDFYFPADSKTTFLNRTERCRRIEVECLKNLSEKIFDLCTNHLTLDHIKHIEENHMNYKLRGKRIYEFIHGKNDSELEDLTAGNKCLLRYLIRVHEPPQDQYENSKFHDAYDAIRTLRRPLNQKAILQLRPPYYDLYTLYLADPLENFVKFPEEERWWNETKAFQALAHFLPENTIENTHKAIKCVYDKISSDEMKWNPDKFCWGTAPFICVQMDRLVNRNCSQRLQQSIDVFAVDTHNHYL